jgi:GNAT superfamily N-acetyltransferase
MVVTHLEMTTQAPLRGAPLPDGLRLDVLPPDPDWYRELFRRIGEHWLWFGRLKLDDLPLCAILEHEDVTLHTLIRDGQPEALLELDFRTPGSCELAYFGVTPALMGMGAGAYLMDRAIELAWARDISKLHVHTCTLDSPHALHFYIRSGFVPVRREIEIADDPRMTGLYPRTVAPQIPLI